MKYHTVFFDIDGTITDSAPAILCSLQKLLLEETGMFYSLDQLEFALGIITSKTSAQYENGFSSLPLANYFECVICADETAYFKPHPAPIFEGIRRLRVSLAGTLFVGDSANDMLCAKAAGIDSALALWGCRRPDRISATHRLSLPCELLEYVLK